MLLLNLTADYAAYLWSYDNINTEVYSWLYYEKKVIEKYFDTVMSPNKCTQDEQNIYMVLYVCVCVHS